MMGRLGNLHAAAAGGHQGQMLDPLAMQLSLVDRDFTEAGAALPRHPHAPSPSSWGVRPSCNLA